jgi:exopolysaccharide biosynthesis polyprenyl glycosylphosphotransferase
MFVLKFWQQILIAKLLAISILMATRYLLVHIGFNVLYRRLFRRQVLVIGSNREAEDVTNHIITLNAPFWVAGTVDPCGGGQIRAAVPKKVLGRLGDLEAILGKNGVQEAIVTDDCIRKSELIDIIDLLTSRGISVWFLPKLMPIIDIKLYIDNFCGMPMIRLNSNRYLWLFSKFKQFTDFLSTALGLAVISPLMIAAAIAVKLDSRGPVFYRPEVVGKNGRRFTMFKFRSMITGASKKPHKEYVTNHIKGAIQKDKPDQPLKITNDPRITRVGRFLRKTSLDELPQLINVLKGQMSLVGPRPCLTYEYEIYKDWHKKRTMVKPGITGLWQVVGRSEVQFEDMVLLDLYYIYNRGIELDFNILIETIFVVLRKKGAH